MLDIFWEQNFKDRVNPENVMAGLALGIKYLNNKNFYKYDGTCHI